MPKWMSAITPVPVVMWLAVPAGIAGGSCEHGHGSCAPAPLVRPAAEWPALWCFDASDPKAVDAVLSELSAQPPTWRAPLLPRLAVDTFSWRDEAQISLGGRAQRASFTYSFPPDGIVWGLEEVSIPGGSTGVSDLSARLELVFGDAELGREYIRQSIAAWARDAGVTYREVADDGSPMTQATARSALRGDIRIGGAPLGVNGVLGYNAFPSPNGAIGTGGGDMLINTSYFGTATFNNPSNDYAGFRNTVTHEHGHGLGLIHVVPCTGSKLMEPFILTFNTGVQIDDARAVARMNGDRYSGSVSPGAAANLGNLTTPTLRSVLEPRLSTNGATGFGNTDEDYFRFTIDTPQDVRITVTPTGGVYDNQQQGFGCIADDVDSVDANRAGNLRLELRDGGGAVVLQTAPDAPAGLPETLDLPELAAGTYVVKVWDIGPNPAVNQVVQLYDLEVRVGDATASPIAVAGLDKRVAADAPAHFIGDLHSMATEEGALLVGYDWDLDGDGAFEATGARTQTTYVSNGEFTATLRATDSLGGAGEDSITVTVFGATTRVTGIEPGAGAVGSSVPVVISGTNLRTVTSASEVSVSGVGVSVVGAPTPNAMGTEITGLSLVIDGSAIEGLRSVTVDAGDGAGVGANLFEVTSGSGTPGDFNGDGSVDASDLASLIAAWGACGGCAEDLDGDGLVGASDLAALIAAWG